MTMLDDEPRVFYSIPDEPGIIFQQPAYLNGASESGWDTVRLTTGTTSHIESIVVDGIVTVMYSDGDTSNLMWNPSGDLLDPDAWLHAQITTPGVGVNIAGSESGTLGIAWIDPYDKRVLFQSHDMSELSEETVALWTDTGLVASDSAAIQELPLELGWDGEQPLLAFHRTPAIPEEPAGMWVFRGNDSAPESWSKALADYESTEAVEFLHVQGTIGLLTQTTIPGYYYSNRSRLLHHPVGW